MTDMMRTRASDALYVLRELTNRGWYVETWQRGAVHTVCVRSLPGGSRDEKYFDAGCLDDAFLQIRLDQFPRRAA